MQELAADLAALFLEDAPKLCAQLWKPCKSFNFGGKDNTYNEKLLDEPAFADMLSGLAEATGHCAGVRASSLA